MGTPAAVRPAWTGSITFGLVAVPVKLYPAIVSHAGPVTHQFHADDLGRIRYRKWCEAEDREVNADEIARGSEVAAGVVVLTDEDMEQLPLPTKHVIDVHAFLDEQQIDALSWDTPYYVGLGDKAPAKPYALWLEPSTIPGRWPSRRSPSESVSPSRSSARRTASSCSRP